MNLLKLFASDHKVSELKGSPVVESQSPQEHPMLFEERFWLWRNSLLFIAQRILNDPKIAQEVVESCFIRASQNPPKLDSNGAFGSWILRILIDEVVVSQCHRKSNAEIACEQAVSGGSLGFL